MPLVVVAVSSTMAGIGMPVACLFTKLLSGVLEMESFLFSLEVGGVVIALVGLRRERWLRRRRR